MRDHTAPTTKGNGCRQASRSEIGAKLTLSVPGDRLGVFNPFMLGIPDEQEEQIKTLCFELYGKGWTTPQMEQEVENRYGSAYSKSSSSRMTTDFGEQVNAGGFYIRQRVPCGLHGRYS